MAEGADWFVSSHDELREVLSKHNVAFIGSGADVDRVRVRVQGLSLIQGS